MERSNSANALIDDVEPRANLFSVRDYRKV
jgi:hypothetical protein